MLQYPGSPMLGGNLLNRYPMMQPGGQPGAPAGLGSPPVQPPAIQQHQQQQPGNPGLENFLKLLQGLGGTTGTPLNATPSGMQPASPTAAAMQTARMPIPRPMQGGLF